MSRKTIWVWALAIVSAVGVEAAASKINSELMDRDLRIMEGILEEILGDGDSSSPVIWGDSGSTRVQGTYYDDYGVLFLVEGNQVRRHLRVHVDHRAGDRNILTIKAKGVVPPVSDPASTEDVTSLQKERLVEFLSSYAGAIHQLKPEDRITIRVNPVQGGDYTHGGPFALPGMSGIHELSQLSELSELHKLGGLHALVDSARSEMEDERSEMEDARSEMEGVRVEIEAAVRELTNAAGDVTRAIFTDFNDDPVPGLIATVLKRDVDAYRGRDGLKGKIRFEEIAEKSDADRDIHIFNGILGSALKMDSEHFGGFRPSGFYQPGIGALFFISHDSHGWAVFLSGENSAEGLETLRSDLIDVVADYGATLKSVQNDEHVVIKVKLKGHRTRGASSATLKAKISDIRDYGRGKINLEAFEKRVEWVEL